MRNAQWNGSGAGVAVLLEREQNLRWRQLHPLGQVIQHELVGLMEKERIHILLGPTCQREHSRDQRRYFPQGEDEHFGPVHHRIFVAADVAVRTQAAD